MNFTLSNIRKRTVLAQCCLADMATRALEYRSEGDMKNADCVTKKAFILQFIIKRMRCFVPAIGIEVYTESFTIPSGFSSGHDFSMAYAGYQITLGNNPQTAGTTRNVAASIIAAAINSYHSSNPDEIYATATVVGNIVTVSILVSPRIDTDGITIDVTVNGATITSNGDGSVSQAPTPRLSNDRAKKLLGIMDAYCGCPCGKDVSNITNDTIPFILSVEP